MPATPTDTYVYLKGGRGDGFVPTWDGTITDEGMVDSSGVIVGTAGKEVSDPYRDIFSVTGVSVGSVPSAGLSSASLPTMSGAVIDGAVTPVTYAGNGYVSGTTTSTTSDEVNHAKPRQYFKVFTWLLFTSSNGLVYKFRKDLVIGWGSAARV